MMSDTLDSGSAIQDYLIQSGVSRMILKNLGIGVDRKEIEC